jgi:predicted RNA binding protein YcfA (HicA-like mRNA interferase family)
MGIKLPILRPKEVVSIPLAMGFIQVRQKGSHKQFRYPDGRSTTVPVHQGRDLSPFLLRQIINDIGLIPDRFIKYLSIAEELGDPLEETCRSGAASRNFYG